MRQKVTRAVVAALLGSLLVPIVAISGPQLLPSAIANKTSQTITFAQPTGISVLGSTRTVAPTASSGLTVTLTSTTTSICTVAGFVITAVASGFCSITASQAGDGTYLPAPDVTRSGIAIRVTIFSVITTDDSTTPILMGTPKTLLTKGQYSANISWTPAVSSGNRFQCGTAYTASFSIVESIPGFVLNGVTAGFFTVDSATATVGNLANAGTFSHTFPATTACQVISTSDIPLTAPVAGKAPVTAIASNGQYSTAITWSPTVVNNSFDKYTAYTASITLTPSETHTVTGVAANFFKVNGNAASNLANSGTFQFQFPATGKIVIRFPNVTMTSPALGQSPFYLQVRPVYNAYASWSPAIPAGGVFAGDTTYTATFTIVPAADYTLTGVPANFFLLSYDGTANRIPTTRNQANAGIFTHTFPKTAAATVISSSNVVVAAPAIGVAPVKSLPSNGQYSTSISWSPTVESTFLPNTSYTANFMLTSDTMTTLSGVAANFFTVNGAAPTVGNAANAGTFSVTYPAKWAINFDSNGATGSQSTLYYTTGGNSVPLPATTTFQKSGYTFGGWATSNVSTSAITAAYSAAAPITYYAIWIHPTSTVTYLANGGSGTMASQSSNATANLITNSFSLANNVFLGWNTAANGSGTSYNNQQSYSFLSNIDLHAQWGNQISYSNAGADSGLPSRTTDDWASGAINLPNAGTMVKVGYGFGGWSATSGGSTAVSNPYTPTSGITLYPVWNANTYTITYFGNGSATGTVPSNQSWTAGTSATPLSSNSGSLGKPGYNFSGWATSASSTTAVTTYGSIGDQAFYAIWTPITYTLAYNLNGGDSVLPQSASLNIYQSTTVASAPTKAANFFGGWNTASNGTGIAYSPGSTFTVDSSTATTVTLTAQWIPGFTVHYNMNGSATAAAADASYASGTSITLSATPVRTGYTFAGWLDSNGQLRNASTSFTVIQNSVLRAQWTAVAITVTYLMNSGTSATPTQSNVYYGNIFSVAATPTRSGYTFNGWLDGTGTYAAGQQYLVGTSNITLTAQWTAINYTVTYDLGGAPGSVPSSLSNRNIGGTFNVSNTSPTWQARTFKGWSDGANTYAPNASYTMPAANVMFTALFTLNGYTSITYALNGGSGTLPTQAPQLEGSTITLASGSGLTRSGYKFAGWADTVTATTTYLPGFVYYVGPESSPLTLTAQWTAGFTTTYLAGKGTGTAPTDATGRFKGDTFVLPASTGLTRRNFQFRGWSDGNVIYRAGATYTVGSENMSFTAQWVKSSFAGLPSAAYYEVASYPIVYATEITGSYVSGSSEITYTIPANALTAGTIITIYGVSDISSLTILPGDTSYLLSTIVSWVGEDGETVEDATTPITLTVRNPQIALGTVVYALNGDTIQTLATSTQAGVITIPFTVDPLFVLGNPSSTPTTPPPAPVAPTPTTVSTPTTVVTGPPPSVLKTITNPKISRDDKGFYCEIGKYVFLREGRTEETPKLTTQIFLLLQNGKVIETIKSSLDKVFFGNSDTYLESTLTCQVEVGQENLSTTSYSLNSDSITAPALARKNAIAAADKKYYEDRKNAYAKKDKEFARLASIRAATVAASKSSREILKASSNYQKAYKAASNLWKQDLADASTNRAIAKDLAQKNYLESLEVAGVSIYPIKKKV